jgi:hypothetical protein
MIFMEQGRLEDFCGIRSGVVAGYPSLGASRSGIQQVLLVVIVEKATEQS